MPPFPPWEPTPNLILLGTLAPSILFSNFTFWKAKLVIFLRTLLSSNASCFSAIEESLLTLCIKSSASLIVLNLLSVATAPNKFLWNSLLTSVSANALLETTAPDGFIASVDNTWTTVYLLAIGN